jgi:tetratricopeptide (TPR) repeat protein
MTPHDRKWLWLALAVAVVVLAFVYVPGLHLNDHKARLARLPTPQLEALTRKNPEDTEARYYLGLAYAQEGRHNDAIREFLVVQAREPDRADVLNDLGVSYMLQERYYEALISLQGALTAQPDFPIAYANMGRLHLATKMPFTATRELERAAKMEPDNVALLCDLGEAYQRTLNLNAALATFKRVARTDPKSVRAALGEGRAYFSLTRYAEAEQALQRAIKLDPNEPGPSLLLGRMKLERATSPNDLVAAKVLLEQAARLDPEEPEGWYDLGRVAFRSNNSKEAIQYFVRALSVSPEHPGATYQLIRALRTERREADAARLERSFREMSLRSREISRLEEVMVANPRDWESCRRLAELYIADRKPGMAALYVGRLRMGKPSDPGLPALQRGVDAQIAQQNRAARAVTPPPAIPSASSAGRPSSGM